MVSQLQITADGKASFKGIYSGELNHGICLVVASYRDGKMYDVGIDSVDSLADGMCVKLEASVSPVSGKKFKCFMLESLSGMKPIQIN